MVCHTQSLAHNQKLLNMQSDKNMTNNYKETRQKQHIHSCEVQMGHFPG